jgi:hypothetical protein
MPEGHDPWGHQALNQQISRELRCAAAASKARQQDMQLPVDPAAAYIVSNPVTHQDTLIRMPVSRQGGSRGSLGAHVPGDSGVPPRPAKPASTTSSITGSRVARAPGSRRTPSVAGSERSVRTSASSVVPPTTVSGGSTMRRYTPQQEALEARIATLEGTLAQERDGRLQVQAELARLQQLLEKRLASDN